MVETFAFGSDTPYDKNGQSGGGMLRLRVRRRRNRLGLTWNAECAGHGVKMPSPSEPFSLAKAAPCDGAMTCFSWTFGNFEGVKTSDNIELLQPDIFFWYRGCFLESAGHWSKQCGFHCYDLSRLEWFCRTNHAGGRIGWAMCWALKLIRGTVLFLRSSCSCTLQRLWFQSPQCGQSLQEDILDQRCKETHQTFAMLFFNCLLFTCSFRLPPSTRLEMGVTWTILAYCLFCSERSAHFESSETETFFGWRLLEGSSSGDVRQHRRAYQLEVGLMFFFLIVWKSQNEGTLQIWRTSADPEDCVQLRVFGSANKIFHFPERIEHVKQALAIQDISRTHQCSIDLRVEFRLCLWPLDIKWDSTKVHFISFRNQRQCGFRDSLDFLLRPPGILWISLAWHLTWKGNFRCTTRQVFSGLAMLWKPISWFCAAQVFHFADLQPILCDLQTHRQTINRRFTTEQCRATRSKKVLCCDVCLSSGVLGGQLLLWESSRFWRTVGIMLRHLVLLCSLLGVGYAIPQNLHALNCGC